MEDVGETAVERKKGDCYLTAEEVGGGGKGGRRGKARMFFTGVTEYRVVRLLKIAAFKVCRFYIDLAPSNNRYND